jgi:hypothetical protein
MRAPVHGEWLRSLEVFGDCDDACTSRLLGQLRLERYQEGDVIVSGQVADSSEAGSTVRIIKEGCVEVCERRAGSQHVIKEVLADGEYFGALPALGVAPRMGAIMVRAMSVVECFALTDEVVRNVLAGGPRPSTSSRPATRPGTSRAGTAEPSARVGTAGLRSTWGCRSGKVGDAKITPRQRLPSSLKGGGVPDSTDEDEMLSVKNILRGDWMSVKVQKVHADNWIDASRSPDDSMATAPLASATPTRGSTTSSPLATPCKPTTPCSRRRAFRRPVYCSGARPCSRKKEDGNDVVPSVPGTPSMSWRRCFAE